MILDTNALSAFAENDQSLLAVLPTDRPWYLPVVVVGEYRFGLRGSQERANREQWLRELLVAITVLPITEFTTEHYATVRHDLKAANRQIPPNDAWIAALALEHGSAVLSRDAHFDLVPGIRRIAW